MVLCCTYMILITEFFKSNINYIYSLRVSPPQGKILGGHVLRTEDCAFKIEISCLLNMIYLGLN